MITKRDIYQMWANTRPSIWHHPETHWEMTAEQWEEVCAVFSDGLEAYRLPDDYPGAAGQCFLLSKCVRLTERTGGPYMVTP